MLLYSPSGAAKAHCCSCARPELERERFHVFPTMRVSVPVAAHGSGDPATPANRTIHSLLLALQESLPTGQRLPAGELPV